MKNDRTPFMHRKQQVIGLDDRSKKVTEGNRPGYSGNSIMKNLLSRARHFAPRFGTGQFYYTLFSVKRGFSADSINIAGLKFPPHHAVISPV